MNTNIETDMDIKGGFQLTNVCSCGKPGKPRVDNGIYSGIHCDDCFTKMTTDCRDRSY